MVEVVKASVPVAEKKPLTESAWATAALLIAKAVRMTRRFNMGDPPGGKIIYVRGIVSRSNY
jgi:hypothetical protein